MVTDVGVWAILLAVGSFITFLTGATATVIAQFRTAVVSGKAADIASQAANQAKPGFVAPTSSNIIELTDLVKALTSAIEAIVKAGPALAGLVASVLFIGIAAWSSGQEASNARAKCTLPAGTVITIADGKTISPILIPCERDTGSRP